MFIKIDNLVVNVDKLNFIKFELEEGIAIATLYFENGEAVVVYSDDLEGLIAYFNERLCNGSDRGKID
jgi:hypothetical protein